jgi:hypothetical protein
MVRTASFGASPITKTCASPALYLAPLTRRSDSSRAHLRQCTAKPGSAPRKKTMRQTGARDQGPMADRWAPEASIVLLILLDRLTGMG